VISWWLVRFLIIGASGFVGRHLLAHVRSRGYEALGTQSHARLPGLIAFDLARQRVEDCLPESFLKSHEPKFAVICAAISQIDRCFRDRPISYAINVDGTIRLLQDLLRLEVCPVFVSTSFVFDGHTGYYDEGAVRAPVCEYGRHKALVEEFIEKDAPQTLVVRLDKVVGDDPREEHLFSEWYRLIQDSRPVECMQGQLFAPTHADDVARGIVLACERNLRGVYGLTNSEFFCRDELARQFASALGVTARIVTRPLEAFDFLDPRPLKTYLDCTRFRRATGMQFTSMREAMGAFIEKLRKGHH